MLELRLLGRYECRDSDGRAVAAVLAQPRTAALLAFLACVRGGDHVRRAVLLPLFWPELDEPSARHALSQAVYRLRQVLGKGMIETRGDEEIRLAREGRWTDVAAFEAAVADQRLDEALSLYAGELLPGFSSRGADGFERWLEGERERLRRLAARASWASADAALARRETETAEEAARRAIAIDPVNETAGRRVIGGLAAAGSPARAMRVYEELRRQLAREYELAPAAETQELARSIQRRGGLEPVVPVPAASGAASAPDPVSAPSSAAAAAEAPTEASAHVPPHTDGRPRRARRGVAIALAAVALLSLLTLAVGSGELADERVPSLVISPFVDRTGDAARAYLADGIHHALAGELAQSARVRVLPPASAPPASGAGRAAADFVVEGTVYLVADSVRVHLRIARTASGDLIWADSRQRAVTELDQLRRELVADVARELDVGLTARGERRLGDRARVDAGAYDAWLRALALEPRRQRDAVLACVAESDRAIARAPAFADAHLLRARCLNVLSFVDTVAPARSFGHARESAQRAIALDPGLARAYAEYAYAVAHHDWDWAEAERLYRQALGLDGSHPHVHGDLAWLLAWQRRFGEALEHARRAEALAPGDVQSLLRTGMILLLAGRPAEAEARAQRALAIDSTSLFAWDRLHWAYHAMDRRADAVRAAERAAALGGPADVRRRGFLANAYARAGRTGEARAILAELDSLRRRVYVPPNALAAAHVGLGERAQAVARLEEAYRGRDGDMVLLATFPLWRDLHEEPRFRRLVAAMRLPAPGGGPVPSGAP